MTPRSCRSSTARASRPPTRAAASRRSGGTGSPTPGSTRSRSIEGHAPRGADEVVIDRAPPGTPTTHLGDPVRVLAAGGTRQLRVAGVVTVAGADNLAGSGLALMADRSPRVRFFATGGRVDYIAVLGARRASAVPSSSAGCNQRSSRTARRRSPVRAMSPSASADIGKQLRVFNAILQAFALVALVAGAFLIYNTFGIIVAQRTRELALLRALGASRRQVIGSVLLEAAWSGCSPRCVGLAAGIGLAAGLRALFGAFGVTLPSAAVGGAPAHGRGVARSSARWSRCCRRCSRRGGRRRVAPVAAMREVAIDESNRSCIRERSAVAGSWPSARPPSCGAPSDRERPRMLGRRGPAVPGGGGPRAGDRAADRADPRRAVCPAPGASPATWLARTRCGTRSARRPPPAR